MGSATDRTVFEGKRTTVRTVAMLKEARRLYTKRTGKRPPGISQGGYNGGGVAASAGTHDRDALDFRTAGMSASLQRIWEECLWAVGFAAWWRPYVYNLWPEHCHAIPKGGDLSQGARYQVSAFKAQRNGLRSNLRYPRIGRYAFVTWESYLRSRPKPAPKPLRKFRLSLFKGSVKVKGYNGGYVTHVAVCQTALQALGYYKFKVDGIKGKETVSAMNRFLAKQGWPKASGRVITLTQLNRLINAAEKLYPGDGYPPTAEK